MTACPPSAQFDRGPAVEGPGFRVQRVEYGGGYRREPHDHETTGITLVLAGGFRETVGGREVDASALSVVVKPAGTVHADVAGEWGARTVSVQIDDEAHLLAGEGDLGPWRWLHAGPGLRPLLALQRTLLGGRADADPEELVLELLGEVLRAPAPRTGDAPFWVRRAREALDDLAPEGIRVGDLAERLSVHPVSLARAFRRAYGVPVTTYRRRVRLRRAAAEVTGSDRRLVRIAHGAGYADQAHMCREVRAATGVTPSTLRALTR